MQVLMLADRSFARREHAMLRRLEVGLLDEGVRVVLAVPETVARLETDTLSASVTYVDRGPWYAARARTRRLIRQIEDLDPPLPDTEGGGPLDVVHAWGDECWNIAVDVAQSTGAGLAADLWSAGSIRRMGAAERRAGAGAPEAMRGVWLAPNVAIQHSAEESHHVWPIRLARWGVHPAEHPTQRYESRREEERPLALSVVSSGRDAGALTPLFGALAEMLEKGADLFVFLDSAAVEQHHNVWRHAEHARLLDRLSIIPDMESRRELLLQTDILVVPEAVGEVRSIVLDAMAAGIAVVARADPHVEVTAEPGIALLVERAHKDDWLEQLTRVVEDPRALTTIGETAREQVGKKRPAHLQVEATLGAYRELVEQRPIAFPVP